MRSFAPGHGTVLARQSECQSGVTGVDCRLFSGGKCGVSWPSTPGWYIASSLVRGRIGFRRTPRGHVSTPGSRTWHPAGTSLAGNRVPGPSWRTMQAATLFRCHASRSASSGVSPGCAERLPIRLLKRAFGNAHPRSGNRPLDDRSFGSASGPLHQGHEFRHFRSARTARQGLSQRKKK